MQKLTKLEWDSNFFEYQVSKLEGEISQLSDIQSLEELLERSGSKLTYFSSSKPIPEKLIQETDLEIKFVDKKVVYVKTLDAEYSTSPYIRSEQTSKNSKILEELSIQSGAYSRFKVDDRIDSKKFEELYRLWMINSLNRQLAKDVLVYENQGKMTGFVTLGEKNKRANIGIIAIDHSTRGKGVGKLLMQAADDWAFQNNYATIQVITQGENEGACRFYEACGFEQEQLDYFYHIWRD